MKKLFITAIISIATLGAFAQTRSGQYNQVMTDHYKDGQHTGKTVKYETGELVIKDNLVTIDVDSMKPQVFSVGVRGDEQKEDEGMFSRSLILFTPTKAGGIKAVQAFILMNPQHVITDLIIKRTKATTVCYSFKN